jgi:hypothetical protein
MRILNFIDMTRMLKTLVFISLTMLAFGPLRAQIIPFPSAGSYGTGYHRIAIDSVVYLPTGCGVPSGTASLRSFGINGQGQKLKMMAIQADTCGHHVYWYDPTDSSWNQLDGGSGGSADSATFQTNYRADTAKANLRAAILLKLNIADSNSAYASWGRLYKTIDSMKLVNDGRYLRIANSLSELSAAPGLARTNLALGTAATHDVPSSGNASSTQVVLGNDTRLTGAAAFDSAASQGGGFHTDGFNQGKYLQIKDSTSYATFKRLYKTLDSLKAVYIGKGDSTAYASFLRLYKVVDSLTGVFV